MLGTAGTVSEMIPKLGAQRSEALHAAIRLVGFQDGRVSGGLDSIRTIAGVCRNATLYMQESDTTFDMLMWHRLTKMTRPLIFHVRSYCM